ncbi:hypothetical protein [Neobacillus piezotolerans]|nr:hypothetical protein [Neobacillus piezotolerans]
MNKKINITGLLLISLTGVLIQGGFAAFFVEFLFEQTGQVSETSNTGLI